MQLIYIAHTSLFYIVRQLYLLVIIANVHFLMGNVLHLVSEEDQMLPGFVSIWHEYIQAAVQNLSLPIMSKGQNSSGHNHRKILKKSK